MLSLLCPHPLGTDLYTLKDASCTCSYLLLEVFCSDHGGRLCLHTRQAHSAEVSLLPEGALNQRWSCWISMAVSRVAVTLRNVLPCLPSLPGGTELLVPTEVLTLEEDP